MQEWKRLKLLGVPPDNFETEQEAVEEIQTALKAARIRTDLALRIVNSGVSIQHIANVAGLFESDIRRIAEGLEQPPDRIVLLISSTLDSMIAVGFLLLSGTDHELRSVGWLWLLGAGCIFSGLTSLEPLLRVRFVGSNTLRCSFCNKSQRDVRKMIAGPQVHICDECVAVCITIIREDAASEPQPPGVEEPVPEKHS